MSDEEPEIDYKDSYSICSQDPTGGASTEPEKPPTLDDHLSRILSDSQIQCVYTASENDLNIAKCMTSRLLSTAYNMHSLYRKYLNGKGGKIAEVVDFRCLNENIYQCLVQLRRPISPDTFQMNFKLPSDFPNHRILICINEAFSSVDRMQILREWGHCIDNNGILRPDFILDWFNEGLEESTTLLQAIKPVEANKIQGATLLDISCRRCKDGTCFIDFAWETDDIPRTEVQVNIVPCMLMLELPKQIRLTAPIPSRRPYFDSQTDFMHKINSCLDSGEKMFFLEARLLRKSQQNSYHSTILGSWAVNVARLEEAAMVYIGHMNGQNYFRDIVTLINRISSVHYICVHPITYRVLVNVILHQHRKHLGKINTREEWFLKILEKLRATFLSGRFCAFFQSKYNLFESIEKPVLKFTGKELKKLVVSVKNNPQNIYHFVGMDEAFTHDEIIDRTEAENSKKDQPEVIEDKAKKAIDDSSTSDSEDETADEQVRVKPEDQTAALTETDAKMSVMYGHKKSKVSKKRKK